MLEVMPFRSRREAQEYIKFQGWTQAFAQVRMFNWPEHPFADENKRGNVAVVRVDMGKVGYQYVFSNGSFQYLSMHGKPDYGI